jgi:hypothetical protein
MVWVTTLWELAGQLVTVGAQLVMVTSVVVYIVEGVKLSVEIDPTESVDIAAEEMAGLDGDRLLTTETGIVSGRLTVGEVFPVGEDAETTGTVTD